MRVCRTFFGRGGKWSADFHQAAKPGHPHRPLDRATRLPDARAVVDSASGNSVASRRHLGGWRAAEANIAVTAAGTSPAADSGLQIGGSAPEPAGATMNAEGSKVAPMPRRT